VLCAIFWQMANVLILIVTNLEQGASHGRHELSTFSWVFCPGVTTPLQLHDVTVSAAVKFGRVPPSPPTCQQEGVDGSLD